MYLIPSILCLSPRLTISFQVSFKGVALTVHVGSYSCGSPVSNYDFGIVRIKMSTPPMVNMSGDAVIIRTGIGVGKLLGEDHLRSDLLEPRFWPTSGLLTIRQLSTEKRLSELGRDRIAPQCANGVSSPATRT